MNNSRNSKDFKVASEIAARAVVRKDKAGHFRDEDEAIEYRRELRRDIMDDMEDRRERSWRSW